MIKIPAFILCVVIILAATMDPTLAADSRVALRHSHHTTSPSPSSATVPNTNEIKYAMLGSIRLYQILLATQDAPACNFEPSCSHFGQEAIKRYGAQGLLMTADRLLRCNGFGLRHYEIDPTSGRAIDPIGGAASGGR